MHVGKNVNKNSPYALCVFSLQISKRQQRLEAISTEQKVKLNLRSHYFIVKFILFNLFLTR